MYNKLQSAKKIRQSEMSEIHPTKIKKRVRFKTAYIWPYRKVRRVARNWAFSVSGLFQLCIQIVSWCGQAKSHSFNTNNWRRKCFLSFGFSSGIYRTKLITSSHFVIRKEIIDICSVYSLLLGKEKDTKTFVSTNIPKESLSLLFFEYIYIYVFFF